MMNSGGKVVPVLSVAQQKRAIAGNRGQKRKVVVNALDSPFDVNWPQLSPEAEGEVKCLLGDCLKPMRCERVLINKEALAAVPKKERRMWRKQLRNSAREKQLPLGSQFAVGLRDVVRSVESGRAIAVICDREAKPPLLTKMLQPLCKAHSLPLVPIRQLSKLLAKILGIPTCLAIAIQVEDCDSLLWKGLARICGSPFPALVETPAEAPSKKRPLTKDFQVEAVVPLADPDEASTPALSDVTLSPSKTDHLPAGVIAPESFYLRRVDQSKCAFIPGGANPLPCSSKSPSSDGFIKLEPTPTNLGPGKFLAASVRKIASNQTKATNMRTKLSKQ